MQYILGSSKGLFLASRETSAGMTGHKRENSQKLNGGGGGGKFFITRRVCEPSLNFSSFKISYFDQNLKTNEIFKK